MGEMRGPLFTLNNWSGVARNVSCGGDLFLMYQDVTKLMVTTVRSDGTSKTNNFFLHNVAWGW